MTRPGTISDTSPAMEAAQVDLLRRATPARRFALVRSLSMTVVALARRGIARANPRASRRELNQIFAEVHYGAAVARQFADPIYPDPDVIASDIFTALAPVARQLDALKVTYFIGGSVASSIYGIARSTLDVDLVADLGDEHVAALVDSLSPEYYLSESAIRAAILHQSCFNLIHLATMVKVDVFVPKPDAYARMALARAARETISDDAAAAALPVASPEDVILSKLCWYRRGEEVSDRQWQDVLGVLKVQRPNLGRQYLTHWAQVLGVADLLARAFQEAG